MNVYAGHRSFTLLEVLLATSLSVLLFSALIAMTAQIPKASDLESNKNPQLTSWLRASLQLLRNDAQSARSWFYQDNQLILLTHQRLDERARFTPHQLGWVIYELKTVDGVSLLIRREQTLESQPQTRSAAELVAYGVTRFRIQEIRPASTISDDRQLGNSQQPPPLLKTLLYQLNYEELSQILEPVPNQLFIELWTTDQASPTFTQRLTIR